MLFRRKKTKEDIEAEIETLNDLKKRLSKDISHYEKIKVLGSETILCADKNAELINKVLDMFDHTYKGSDNEYIASFSNEIKETVNKVFDNCLTDISDGQSLLIMVMILQGIRDCQNDLAMKGTIKCHEAVDGIEYRTYQINTINKKIDKLYEKIV